MTPLPETDATYRVALARATARSHERMAELGYAARRPSAFERVLIPSA